MPCNNSLTRWIVSALIFLAPLGTARAISIQPKLPYVVATSTGGGGAATVWYSNVDVDTNGGYHKFNFSSSSSSENIGFYFSSIDANATYVALYSYDDQADTYQRINLAGCGSGVLVCGADYAQLSTSVTEPTLYVNLKTACLTTAGVPGCDGAQDPDVAASARKFILKVCTGATQADVQNASNCGSSFGATINVGLETQPPTVGGEACDSGIALTTSPYFPSDGAIIVDPQKLVATQNTVEPGSPQIDKLMVFANEGSIGATVPDLLASQIAVAVGRGAAQTVGNFQNSTETESRPYHMKFGVRDSSGAVAICDKDITPVYASDIRTFLKESNCFIATASFRSGRAAPVMLLREFRDRILLKSGYGRAFVSWYYAWSPEAAEWLIERPAFRIPVLFALIPVEAISWLVLHPGVALLLLSGALLALARASGRRGAVALLAVAAMLPLSARADDAKPSQQPYIDALLGDLPDPRKDKEAELPEATRDNPDPYVQQQKKNLPPPGEYDDDTDYTGRLQQELKQDSPPGSSEGYAEKLRQAVPPKGESAIDDLNKGRELHADKGNLHARQLFSLGIGVVTSDRDFTSATATDLAYSSIYTSGWIPDLNLFYEYRPFEPGWAGSIGFAGSFGLSYVSGNGQFSHTIPQPTGLNGDFGSQSRTKAKFFVMPAELGLSYRMNFFGLLWPYVAGGGAAIGFLETRDDGQDSMRGYSLGYWTRLGISVGLDWLSPDSAWDRYDSMGFKHTYLSVEGHRIATVPSGRNLLEVEMTNVNVAFTFEF